jgi:molybdenum cofactor cytidylyltransferase
LTREADPETKLEAVVLAAGSGSRFGGAKLTAPWRGGFLIDGALAAAFAAPVRSVTVVTGADPKVAPAAHAFAEAQGQTHRLRLVHAPDHAEGMAAPLRTGIAALPPDAAAAFVFLGDMPLIPAEVPPRLAEALAAGASAAAPAFQGQRGHPVLFSAALFADLAKLQGDEGARSVLKALGGQLVIIESPGDGVLVDIDRPGDLGGLAKR